MTKYSAERDWYDNADSYLCPDCGYETSNPLRSSCIAKCPRCGFVPDKYNHGHVPEMVAGKMECPNCHDYVVLPAGTLMNYCCNCGTKLDWNTHIAKRRGMLFMTIDDIIDATK